MSTGYETGRPERHTKTTRRIESARQLDLFSTKSSRGIEFTEGQRREGGGGAPWLKAGADSARSGHNIAYSAKVDEGLSETTLCESKSATHKSKCRCRQ